MQIHQISRPYLVQHEMNSNASKDATVSFKADNVGDLSHQLFDDEGVSNHGTGCYVSKQSCRPEAIEGLLFHVQIVPQVLHSMI